jgi:hypothetical protein
VPVADLRLHRDSCNSRVSSGDALLAATGDAGAGKLAVELAR